MEVLGAITVLDRWWYTAVDGMKGIIQTEYSALPERAEYYSNLVEHYLEAYEEVAKKLKRNIHIDSLRDIEFKNAMINEGFNKGDIVNLSYFFVKTRTNTSAIPDAFWNPYLFHKRYPDVKKIEKKQREKPAWWEVISEDLMKTVTWVAVGYVAIVFGIPAVMKGTRKK